MEANGSYLMKIKGTQVVDGESTTIEYTTRGSMDFSGDGATLTYLDPSQSEERMDTVLEIEQNRVTLSRTDNVRPDLIIESGQRHLCHYETDYGALLMGISANMVKYHLSPEGGEIHLRYTLDINSYVKSENELWIHVTLAH